MFFLVKKMCQDPVNEGFGQNVWQLQANNVEESEDEEGQGAWAILLVPFYSLAHLWPDGSDAFATWTCLWLGRHFGLFWLVLPHKHVFCFVCREWFRRHEICDNNSLNTCDDVTWSPTHFLLKSNWLRLKCLPVESNCLLMKRLFP